MPDQVTISYKPSPKLAAFVRALGPAGRRPLNEGAALELWAAVREHLRREAQWRHGSAQKLGAHPTGHLEKAAQSTAPHADEQSASVTVASPGISRAFHPLQIAPVRAQSLTIPVHWLGYGQRASEVSAAYRLFRPKGKDYLMADVEGTPTVIYLLRKQVTVPQDRSLLPSDADVERTTTEAMEKYIVSVCRKVCRAV